ncbi:hypothetical protein ACFSCX_06535 [Bacillus salitolerans]|uniref:Uncharacterized protein n=1 Tax=Bacillus salitolerans TaxID=1437434 RepID=A0ABW4LM09_9BACI
MTINKTMLFAVAVTFFLVAATQAITTFSTLDRAYDNLLDLDSRKGLTQNTMIPKEEITYTGAEVVDQLYQIHDIGVPIIIESTTFPSHVDITSTSFSMIDLNHEYKQVIIRDTQGNITEVHYNR